MEEELRVKRPVTGNGSEPESADAWRGAFPGGIAVFHVL